MIANPLDRAFDAQRAAFAQHRYPAAREREAHLETLHHILTHDGDAIADAISQDFGHRAHAETRILELFPSAEAVKHARTHVARWMRPVRRKSSPWFFPGQSRIVRQPVGVTGIIVPWNYPINMTFGPLAGAIAAGNRVMIKMSEFVPRTGELLAKLFAEHFAENHIAVINGGVDVARAFSEKPWDHLLFTGSTTVGRDVMRAAANHLTPVTLELGGKSPAIIAPGFDIATAARRIMLGKCVNAGQTCIAPDYVMLPSTAIHEFVSAAGAVAAEFYPNGAGDDNYCSIINQHHYARITTLRDDARAHGATIIALLEGESAHNRKMPPAIVSGVHDDMRIMQEEIFGPLLPVVEYNNVDEALAYIASHPRPLSMYYFDTDTARTARVLRESVAGGVTVNGTLLHFAQEDLPFGGVGASGVGRYHGEHGFDTFSVQKGVYYRSLFNMTKLFEPPFGRGIDRLVRWAMR